MKVNPYRRARFWLKWNPGNPKSNLVEAQSKYETALLKMNKALAGNEGSEAGINECRQITGKRKLTAQNSF